MSILSWGVKIFNTPNFNGPTNFVPVSWTCHIFFGVSRTLIEAVGEEKRLIEIILQIMTIIPLLLIDLIENVLKSTQNLLNRIIETF